MNTKEIFDFEAISDFDKHISLSIPNYDGLCDVFRAISLENLHPQGRFVDIGCSTGSFINSIPKPSRVEFIGVDLVDIRTGKDSFSFMHQEASEYLDGIGIADVIVVMFTLQFAGRHNRRKIIKELVRLNKSGATILIAEKVYIDNSKLNQTLHREHIRTKRESFTDSEILEKDYQLSGSMFCKTDTEINLELGQFGEYHQIWQSYNFKAWCINGK
jgi:SAM-dependent methyltransferase